jgi:predicted nucleotidyltransferase
LVGDGTTSATADIEEEIDDGASDVSNTSFLVRSVARDGDLSRGWEDLDSGYTTREKARQRLQKSIYQLNKRHRPSPAVIAARREMLAAIRKRLNNMLKDYTPNFQYRLETFGSTAYGLDTDTSDLDLCIVDPHRPEGFRNASDLYDLSTRFSNDGKVEALATTEEDEENAASTPFSRHKRNKKWAEPEIRKRLSLGEIYDVHRLANALRNMRYQQVIAIPNAIVPIVKFKSQEGIKADMVRDT